MIIYLRLGAQVEVVCGNKVNSLQTKTKWKGNLVKLEIGLA